MNCREYISEYLSAHVDGELSVRQRRAADEHVGGCLRCRARLADERSLKVLLRQHAGIVKTPADVRLRIRAALTEMDKFPARGSWRDPDADGDSGRYNIAALTAHRSVWMSVIAASIVLSLVLFRGRTIDSMGIAQARDVPAFDLAISKYNEFTRSFAPNVPTEAFTTADGAVYAWVEGPENASRSSDEIGDLGRSYEQVNLPGDLLNLASSGYELYGGRVDQLDDGRPVAYTLYRNGNAAVLSMTFKQAHIAPPAGARLWLGLHSFYQYKGYGVCMTLYPTGHFVSLVVSRAPVTQVIRTVALADMASTDQ